MLHSLEVPKHAWELIGIDFVGLFPESKDQNGVYNSITVIICLVVLTGIVHLIPSRIKDKAPQVAKLLYLEVYKHHSLPLQSHY